MAIGLLGISHPEIQRFRTSDIEPATRTVEQPALQPTHASKPAPSSRPLASNAQRGLKFAIAALLRWGTK
jgi:hypothetical protein